MDKLNEIENEAKHRKKLGINNAILDSKNSMGVVFQDVCIK